MPAISPRIAVTLDSQTYEAVRYLSLASGESMSALVAEVVKAAAPVFSRTADILAAAKRARDTQRKGLMEAAQEAEERLKPLAASVAQACELSFAQMASAASAPHPSKGGARRGRDGPPSSNHGGQVMPLKRKGKQRKSTSRG